MIPLQLGLETLQRGIIMATYRVCARYHVKGGTSAVFDKVRLSGFRQLSVSDGLTVRQVYDQVEGILREEYPDFEQLIGLELNRNY